MLAAIKANGLKQEMAVPLITTVIPTYRRPNLIGRAIASALGQSYRNVVVSVYDNASDDETEEVVRAIAATDARVQYFRHPRNVGPYQNFRFGLENVRTPYFSFLSDDDELLPGFYEEAVSELAHQDSPAFFSCRTVIVDEHGMSKEQQHTWRTGLHEPPDGLFEMISHPMPWTSIVFRTDAAEKIGGLDTEVGPPIDKDFLFRLSAKYPFIASQTSGARFHEHAGSISSGRQAALDHAGWQRLVTNLASDASLPSDVRVKASGMLTSQLKRRLFWMGATWIQRGDFSAAIQTAKLLRSFHRSHVGAAVVFLMAWCSSTVPYFYRCIMAVASLVKHVRRKRAPEA